jgi:hypothetical protein
MSDKATTHIVVALEIGEYTIVVKDDSWWLQASNGEGMEIGAAEIEQMFDDYYRDNF